MSWCPTGPKSTYLLFPRPHNGTGCYVNEPVPELIYALLNFWGVRIYIYVYIYTRICIYIYYTTCVYVYIHYKLYVYTYVYIYVCMYVYIYICIYICICICIYMYSRSTSQYLIPSWLPSCCVSSRPCQGTLTSAEWCLEKWVKNNVTWNVTCDTVGIPKFDG